ncbi:MAG: amidohydrolase family protein, partial [Actinobacteria bacterium]|nr:amidohydrolase family protein [Actinomycetota bacterium]MCG2806845.1 amidohydrolase family protein [Coriobacteriia bacterium]
DVIDAHTHLFTVGLLEEYLATQPPEAMQRFRTAVKERKFGRRGDTLPDMSPEQVAAWYVERLNAADVAKALVVSVMPDTQYTRDFIVAAKGHVHALCNVDPRDPGAPALLEREMAAGFKGVKLLPVNRCYHLSDPACRPFFEKASELSANLIIHYGVTVDPTGDLRYADPLDLSPVARDFPDLSFVIAHMGAGWLDSVLRLAYQCKNVCVDTSGTNNWMDYYVPKMSLSEVFERALTALGPERILFGTDSGTTSPYRTWIRRMQQRTFEEMGLSSADLDLVMRGNASRIFRLDE